MSLCLLYHVVSTLALPCHHHKRRSTRLFSRGYSAKLIVSLNTHMFTLPKNEKMTGYRLMWLLTGASPCYSARQLRFSSLPVCSGCYHAHSLSHPPNRWNQSISDVIASTKRDCVSIFFLFQCTHDPMVLGRVKSKETRRYRSDKMTQTANWTHQYPVVA